MYPYRQVRYSYGPYRSPPLAPEPDVDLLARQLDEDMMNMRAEMERRMQQTIHHVPHVLPPIDMGIRRSPSVNRYSLATVNHSPALAKPRLEKYELTMDVSPFTPEELTVKLEGRQLIVTGKRDKKTETENGGCHHEFRDFRREVELPEGVNPEDIQCSLSGDGQLFIQTQSPELPSAQERLVPIHVGQVSGGRL